MPRGGGPSRRAGSTSAGDLHARASPRALPLDGVHLTSEPLVENDFNVSSDLTLVWWQDRFDLPLAAEIERVAAGIDRERSARDVEFW